MRITLPGSDDPKEFQGLNLRVFWQHYRDEQGRHLNKATCFIVDGTEGAETRDEQGNFIYYTLGCVGGGKKPRQIVKSLNRKLSFDKAVKRLFPDNHELRQECWRQAHLAGVHFGPRSKTAKRANHVTDDTRMLTHT